MNGAKKLKYREPRFMAVEKEKKRNKEMTSDSKKNLHLDTTVVLAWIAVIVLTVIFWILIMQLF